MALQNGNDEKNNGDGSNGSAREERRKRRKRRWGDTDAELPPAEAATTAVVEEKDVTPDNNNISSSSVATNATTAASASSKVLAMQESIRARLAAAKAKAASGGGAGAAGGGTSIPAPVTSSSTTAAAAAAKAPTKQRKGRKRFALAAPEPGAPKAPAKRAKHYDLDLNDVGGGPNNNSTLLQRKKQQKPSNPYLAHLVAEEEAKSMNTDDNNKTRIKTEQPDIQKSSNDNDDADAAAVEANEDLRLGPAERKRGRNHKRKQLQFTEPGYWTAVAEKKRERAAAAAAAGFVSGRKVGHTIRSAGMSNDIYGGGGGLDGDDDDDDNEETDASALPDRADAQPDGNNGGGSGSSSSMPLCLEWWDMELLPSMLKKRVAAAEKDAMKKQRSGQKAPLLNDDNVAENKKKNENENAELFELQQQCWEHASLSYSKTAPLVQHIVPILSAAAASAQRQEKQKPVLHLTQKERRRIRKLRRQEAARQQQDLQAAGLVPAPEPRLTLQNFLRVLGDQAYTDPSQMERKVHEQMQARQTAHLERNEARKLTKEQRAAKRANKLLEDTSQSVSTALFWVLDLSHPHHRALVDLNAQQYNLTGGVLQCEQPETSCCIVEGGPKGIRKFIRLMLHRIHWKGKLDEDDDDDDEGTAAATTAGDGSDNDLENTDASAPRKFNPDNACALLWEGMTPKRHFPNFSFQAVQTSVQATAVLAAAGCGQYWDSVLQQLQKHKRLSDSASAAAVSRRDFSLKLGPATATGDNDDVDGDVVMAD